MIPTPCILLLHSPSALLLTCWPSTNLVCLGIHILSLPKSSCYFSSNPAIVSSDAIDSRSACAQPSTCHGRADVTDRQDASGIFSHASTHHVGPSAAHTPPTTFSTPKREESSHIAAGWKTEIGRLLISLSNLGFRVSHLLISFSNLGFRVSHLLISFSNLGFRVSHLLISFSNSSRHVAAFCSSVQSLSLRSPCCRWCCQRCSHPDTVYILHLCTHHLCLTTKQSCLLTANYLFQYSTQSQGMVTP